MERSKFRVYISVIMKNVTENVCFAHRQSNIQMQRKTAVERKEDTVVMIASFSIYANNAIRGTNDEADILY
ncbi:MAG: hypothetical protein QG670_263 [Thermoproteota archaeon]|nr:hypothetical protein [Thermoproteota archaeon]